MLGSNLVCNVDSKREVALCNDYFAVVINRRAGNLCARQQRNLAFKLGADGLGKAAAVGYEHRARHFVVLGLRKQIGSDIFGHTG